MELDINGHDATVFFKGPFQVTFSRTAREASDINLSIWWIVEFVASSSSVSGRRATPSISVVASTSASAVAATSSWHLFLLNNWMCLTF